MARDLKTVVSDNGVVEVDDKLKIDSSSISTNLVDYMEFRPDDSATSVYARVLSDGGVYSTGGGTFLKNMSALSFTKIGGTSSQILMADGSVQKFAYAGIYVDDGATAQAIATGTTYTKLTGFTLDQISRNATSDVANDQIVITELGDYDIGYSISYQSGTPNVTFEVGVFGGLTGAGVEQKQIHTDRRLTSSDTGSASGRGLLRVSAVPYYVDLRASHDNGSSVNITMVSSSLIVNKIGI